MHKYVPNKKKPRKLFSTSEALFFTFSSFSYARYPLRKLLQHPLHIVRGL